MKKGDKIKIISGNDRGKTGAVARVLPSRGMLVVDGVNLKKKHLRPRSAGKKGEIVRIPAPFPMSRAQLLCAHCGKATRPLFRAEAGRKVRVCRKCGKEL